MVILIIRQGIDMETAAMMIKKTKILIAIALAAVIMAGNGIAMDVEYLGTITDGLYSPTSVAASGDMVAVLDPYAGNLSFFSPDGPIIRKVNLSGEAHSLTKLAPDLYAYCDRARQTIMAYDMAADRQYDYLEGQSDLIDPVDLIYDGARVHVLDASSSAIYIFDSHRILMDLVLLADESGSALAFASNFAYDARHGLYFVIDQTNSRICRYDTGGQLLGSLTAFGSGEGNITRAGEIALTDNGLVLVADRYQGRVGVFDGNGVFFGYFGDGGSGESPLSIPTGISIDENGIIYVVSTMGASIAAFYLPRVMDETNLLTVQQQFPDDGAEAFRDDVTLEVSVEAYRAAERVSGFEFQIFEVGLNGDPVDESQLIAPDVYIELPNDRQRVAASWTSELAFQENTDYSWRSRVHTADTIGEWTALRSFTIGSMPKKYRLDQNVPNPFNPATKISFTLGEESDVILEVINLLGQKIRVLKQGRYPSGDYEVSWDGTDDEGVQTASGIYFYRLRAGEFTQSRKMVLLK
jgi:hypothetical protein